MSSLIAPQSAFRPAGAANRDDGVAFIVILMFAALFAIRIDGEQRFFQPELRWGWPETARWIGDPGGAEVIHLRRRLSLSAAPRRAFIQVAAIDAFEIKVNGIELGSSTWIGATPTAAFDLTPVLKAGDNAIAITAASHRSAFPAGARAVLRWEQLGQWSSLSSDARWRVNPVPMPQRQGTVEWSEPGYSDSAWPAPAELADPRQAVPLVEGDLPALLFDGTWTPARIWHSDLRSGFVSFSRTIRIDERRIHGAWLGIGLGGTYALTVNGWALPPRHGAASRLDVHAIGPLLRRGKNCVEIIILGPDAPDRLSVIGGVVTPSGWIDLSGSAQWKSGPGGDPVRIVDRPAGPVPALVAARLEPPSAFRFRQGVRLAGLGVATALAALAAGWIFTVACRWRSKCERALAWRWFAQPLAVAAVVFGLVELVASDPRTQQAVVGAVPLAPIVLVGIVFWLLLRLILTPPVAGTEPNGATAG